MKYKKFLAVGAHIDDIEISCGGLLADATENSAEVMMLVLSDSSYDYYDGRKGRSKEEAYQEGQNAANILRSQFLVLDFPTKDIPYNSSCIEAIESVVNKIKPDIIITHWVYDSHPSHRNTALSTIAACRYYNNILMFEPMMPSGRTYQGFRGQLYQPLSEKAINLKTESLKAHVSQFLRYGEHFWIDAIISRNVHRGFEIGAQYAECFEVVRMQGLL
jgi:LmbE family N-acetylglucosaminyl deacetylase